MATALKALALCTVLVLDVAVGEHCKRKQEADWSGFDNAVGNSGFGNEDGISTIATNIRTGFHSLPEPQAYAIVGGGEWGPRVVARALLDSVLVDWSNDVLVLDMMEEVADDKGNQRGVFWASDSGLQEAQTHLNAHLCDAIMRCPGRAAVVLDNVHLLQGEDIRVLDTMLSLLDGAKSNMDCKNGKVSGEGSLFLLLLNEEGPEETKRLKGKERLLEAWKFRGLEFTTNAFVGRMDAAVSLSEKPRQLVPGMEEDWRNAKAWPPADSGGSIASTLQGIWERAAGVLKDHPKLAAAGAATATILVAGYLCFQNTHASERDGDAESTAQGNAASTKKGGDKGGDRIRSGLSPKQEKAVKARGGGLQGAPPNHFHGGEEGEGGGGGGGSGAGGACSASASPIAPVGADPKANGDRPGDAERPTSEGEVAAVGAESGPNGDGRGEADAAGMAMSTRSRGRRHSAQTGTAPSTRSSKGRRKSRSSGTRTRDSSSGRSGGSGAKSSGGGGAT